MLIIQYLNGIPPIKQPCLRTEFRKNPGLTFATNWEWFMALSWQYVKTNSTPVVHIKIAGIYGCE